MTFQNGDSIGRYHILEPLGEGGMALVYKAYDTRLERNVALKVIRFGTRQDGKFRQRFEREAQALAALSHPNIVKVLDYGEHEGTPYLVMEYIPGGTLKSRINAGALPYIQALRLAADIACALGHAHENGIIHRDVKPSNILIAEDGRPMLSDFGIAKIIEGERSADLTGTGVGVGTPEYMAPEQGLGKGVDARADIYALGVVLYEMVTGRRPFQADTPMAVMLAHLNDPLPRPRQFAPSLPESVEQVILKALMKQPVERYPSMAEFAAACEAALSGADTQEIKPSARQAARKGRGWGWALGALGLLTILGLGGFAARGFIQPPVPILTQTFLPSVAASIAPNPITLPTITETQVPVLRMYPIPSATPGPSPTFPPSRTPTQPPLPSPMPKPLAVVWKRLNSLQELARNQLSALALDPLDPEVIYAGTLNAGMYKTIDGGRSWQPVQNGMGRAAVLSLAVDPADPLTLYAGTSQGGVYKTIDGGQNWFVSLGSSAFGNPNVSLVRLDRTTPGHLYYTNSQGVYETLDGGKTWINHLQGIVKPCHVYPTGMAVHPKAGNVLFISQGGSSSSICPSGVYKSTDSGKTWQMVNSQEILGGYNSLEIDPQEGNFLYSYSYKTLDTSTDGGKTWNKLLLTGGFFCRSIAVLPETPATAYCAETNHLWQTVNGGKSWSLAYQFPETGVNSLISSLQVQARTIYFGSQGLYRSPDQGKTWQLLKSGLGSARFDLGLSSDQRTLFARLENGSLYSLNPDGSGLKQQSGETMQAMDAAGKIFYSKERISKDQGKTWQPLSFPLPTNYLDNHLVTAHPSQTGWVYVIYKYDVMDTNAIMGPYIFYSDNFGATWKANKGIGRIVDARLYFEPGAGNVVYAVGDAMAYRSMDKGQSWEACSAPRGWSANSETRLAIHPKDSSRIYLATRGQGVQVSTNGCDSWQDSNQGLGSLFVNSIAINPQNPDTLYAGTDGGMYISQDGGKNWQAANEGLLGALVVYSVVVDPAAPENVTIGTPYGIFRMTGK